MLKVLVIVTLVTLSGCAGLGFSPNESAGMQDLFKQILTSPACAHDDKIAVVTGAAGIPGSVTASAERHCPLPAPGTIISNDGPATH